VIFFQKSTENTQYTVTQPYLQKLRMRRDRILSIRQISDLWKSVGFRIGIRHIPTSDSKRSQVRCPNHYISNPLWTESP